MLEVIWHARGGQGAFTAARVLGAAASADPDTFALAFPTFGPERRGAPMRAYTKIAARPIGDRSASRRAAIVVYLDDTLFADGWEDELAEGGVVLLNSKVAHPDARVVTVDGSGLAADILGRAIPNTVFLGAIAALCDAVTLENVEEGIRATMPAKLHERNIAVVRAAYDLVAGRARADALPCCSEAAPIEGASGEKEREASSVVSAEPPARIIPQLQELTVAPERFARSTCFQGGHLVSKNAGWRSLRPLVDQQACTGCFNCYLLCPDGTIYKQPGAGSSSTVAIDYDFCKGCGICAKACPAHCIAMVEEGGGRDEALHIRQ